MAADAAADGNTPTVVPWYDWALAGAVTVLFVFVPKLALLLAYHL